MNLKQAQYMKTIAACGSITTAAKKLFVSQPSLSQMLHQIEEDLGVILFDRSVSPFRITYAGEKYLKAADAIIAANLQLENELNEIKHETSGRLRLGISVTRAMQVMPVVLPDFIREYPNVSLELTETGSASLEELLQNGSIDLALAAMASTSTGFAYELIEQETIGILAGMDAHVARKFPSGTSISLSETQNDAFVYLTQGHSSRVVQDKLFRRCGFKPRKLIETNSLEVGRRVALDTGACMILPNIYADEYVFQRHGSFFPLADYENHRHFYACYRKGEFLPRYTRDFIQMTTDGLAQARAQNRKFHQLP